MHRNHATDFPTDWVKLKMLTGETTQQVVPQAQFDLVTAELKKLASYTNCPESTFLKEIHTKCFRPDHAMNLDARTYFNNNGYIQINGLLNPNIRNILIRSIFCAPDGTLSLVSPLAPNKILKRPTVAETEPPPIQRNTPI